MSIQSSISEQILQIYSDAVVKKVDRDNHLDIHLPHIHPKKGTHLFFNTSRGKIRVGFYCREEEFVSSVLAKSDLLEKYSQGVRLKNNPQFEEVEDAVKAAVSLIDAIAGPGHKAHSPESKKAQVEDTEPELDTKPNLDTEDDNRGFPMISYRKPSEDKKEAVQAYFQKWQKPSTYYARQMGITAFIPEFIEELVSDDVCPVFTEKQIRTIYNRIKKDKEIPFLSYAPSELFHHTKQVWWIVPFCIWKKDVASMVMVDKNGFHAPYENDGELQILMIFSWDKLDDIDFEYGVDDDPNICRLTLYQENGGYLTFDEFISEGKDGDHGSYLRVIEAIWETRRKTIEASRGESVWFEGAGGETFEVYEHPSYLYKNVEDKADDIYRTINRLADYDNLIAFVKANNGKIDLKKIYQGLSESLKTDKAVLAYMLSSTQNVFSLFPEEIKKDKAFIINWITKTRESLQKAEEQNAADSENEDVVNAYEATNKAAGLAPQILVDMDDSLINDEEILAAALSCKYVSFIEKLNHEKWGMDKEWAVKAAKMKIHSVHYLPEYLKNDEDVCKALLDVNIAAFNFFSEEMKHNKIIQEYALSKDGYVFEIFPEEYKKDKQYIKSMLQECPADQNDRRGSMVAVAESPLNNDLELLNLAIEKNADIFQEFYSTDRYCKELFELFLKVTPRIYKHVPENLKDDKDLFISLLSGSYDAEMRVSIFKNSNWYHSPEFGIELINKSTNPDSYSYLKPELQNDDRLLAVLYNVASKQRYKPGGAFDPETSLKFVDQLLKYDKDKSRAYYLRARHIDEYNLSYDDCINALQSCLEINPSHVSALILIGSKSKDVSEAINFFEKALAVEPTNRSAYYNLGYKLTYAERYQEAVDNFNKALEIKPDDHTRANIGKCLLNLNQVDKAIVVLEEATTGTPYLDDAHYDLAKAYVATNRIDKAFDAIDKAIKAYDRVDYYEFKLKIYRDYTNKAEQAEALQGLVDFLKATNGKRQEQIDYLGKLNSDKEFSFLSVYTRISDFLINHILENGTLSAMSQLIINPELKPEQKEKLETIINDKSSNMEKKKFIKIILSGMGSEVVQGLITKEEFSEFMKFTPGNSLSNKSEAWIAYLEEKGLESTSEEIKEYYWDYNDVSHFTGINLDELTIEVYSGDEKLLFSSTYQGFRDDYEDFLEENSLNSSEGYGKYFYPKTSDCLVTYKSQENLTFTFQIHKHSEFDPEKLGIIRVSTDEMGNGTDYGDYVLGLVYDGEKYDEVDHSSFGGDYEVYFEK